MTRRRGFARAARWFAPGLALLGALALGGAPSQAFDPTLGSKNFTSPGYVPNYFSNEGAPFGRGSQAAQPAADRFSTAPVATGNPYTAVSDPSPNSAESAERATYRGRLARGKTGHARSASSRTARAHQRGARGQPARLYSPARATSRHSATTKNRAAASRSSRAGQVRQASR